MRDPLGPPLGPHFAVAWPHFFGPIFLEIVPENQRHPAAEVMKGSLRGEKSEHRLMEEEKEREKARDLPSLPPSLPSSDNVEMASFPVNLVGGKRAEST